MEFQPWDSFPISFPKPRTKGHAPNQLTNPILVATHQNSYYMPRTISVTRHFSNRYPKGEATYPIRFGFRSSHCRCALSEPPFERVRASGPPHSRYRVITANAAAHQDQFGISQVRPRKEAPETIQGKPRPYVSLGGP
jgi:hypothetical protein